MKKPIGMQEANHRAKEKLKREMRSLLDEAVEETGRKITITMNGIARSRTTG